MAQDETKAVAKAIKQDLHRRSGKSWSVRSKTRGTGYGYITIKVPSTDDATDYHALAEELGRLMGYNEGRLQITFRWGDYDDMLRRAAGTLADPVSCGLCGTEEYRRKAPYCERCQAWANSPHITD